MTQLTTRPDRDHRSHQQTGGDRHRRDPHGTVHNTQNVTRDELHHAADFIDPSEARVQTTQHFDR
jgi:hypothetical protein